MHPQVIRKAKIIGGALAFVVVLGLVAFSLGLFETGEASSLATAGATSQGLRDRVKTNAKDHATNMRANLHLGDEAKTQHATSASEKDLEEDGYPTGHRANPTKIVDTKKRQETFEEWDARFREDRARHIAERHLAVDPIIKALKEVQSGTYSAEPGLINESGALRLEPIAFAAGERLPFLLDEALFPSKSVEGIRVVGPWLLVASGRREVDIFDKSSGVYFGVSKSLNLESFLSWEESTRTIWASGGSLGVAATGSLSARRGASMLGYRALTAVPNSSMLVCRGPNDGLVLFDRSTGEVEHFANLQGGDVKTPRYTQDYLASADGKWLISLHVRGAVHIYDIPNRREVMQSKLPSKRANGGLVAFDSAHSRFYGIKSHAGKTELTSFEYDLEKPSDEVQELATVELNGRVKTGSSYVALNSDGSILTTWSRRDSNPRSFQSYRLPSLELLEAPQNSARANADGPAEAYGDLLYYYSRETKMIYREGIADGVLLEEAPVKPEGLQTRGRPLFLALSHNGKTSLAGDVLGQMEARNQSWKDPQRLRVANLEAFSPPHFVASDRVVFNAHNLYGDDLKSLRVNETGISVYELSEAEEATIKAIEEAPDYNPPATWLTIKNDDGSWNFDDEWKHGSILLHLFNGKWEFSQHIIDDKWLAVEINHHDRHWYAMEIDQGERIFLFAEDLVSIIESDGTYREIAGQGAWSWSRELQRFFLIDGKAVRIVDLHGKVEVIATSPVEPFLAAASGDKKILKAVGLEGSYTTWQLRD